MVSNDNKSNELLININRSDGEDEDKIDCNRLTIDDLPYVVFEYILSHLSPYNDLLECKLVSKSWKMSVMSTIAKMKRDFITSLSESSIEWDHYYCPSTGGSIGPSISPRYSHSCCCVESKVYVFGGCTIANTTFNDLWRFDLSNRTWIRPIATGTFPSPKACASLVEYKNNLILFGGWTHSSPYPIHQEWRLFNHIHIFDTQTDRWSLIEPKSYCPPIAGHSASIVGDQMVVFGGLQSEPNNPTPFSSSNDLWVLNLNHFVWHKQLTSNLKPLPRYGHSQVVIDDNHILIMGGSGGPNMLFSDIWLLTIPQHKSLQWIWKRIQIKSSDQTIAPQINFHPACKISNIVIVLNTSQKVRTVQCKDGNIFRKPSVRNQYVKSSSNTTTHKLEPQLSNDSMPANHCIPQTLHTMRPICRKNRQRQLEGLDRMEQRLRQLKAKTFSPLPVRSAAIKSNMESTLNPMQMFALDISKVIVENTAQWLPKNHYSSEGPEEVILYSLVAGRTEIIMFGGIQKDKNMKHNTPENCLNNNVPDIVSNHLHIIKPKTKII